MPLVVPILRLFVVFLNVYETFKTLKPPPPSARRGGQPSVRAITQRKRDLKGCLAVWVVWCCYAVYERTFDRVVGIFLPFYSEIKSVFLLFLVLTRAKGAEPLFLHVLRPFVRPYVVAVDPMLEISRDLGDFFFALLQIPLDHILSLPWFPFWRSGEWEEEPDDSSSGPPRGSTCASSQSNPADQAVGVWASRVQSKRHEFVCNVFENYDSNGWPPVNHPSNSGISLDRHSKSTSTTSLPAYNEDSTYDPPRYSQTLSNHQIWYPAVSVSPASGQAPITTLDFFGTAPEYRSTEWRTYPAFPSAYPPTPLPASASLPSSVTRGSDYGRRNISDSAHPPIPEDEQGFDELLGRRHKGHPGSVRNPSNGSKILPGVNSCERSRDSTCQRGEDTLDDSVYSSEAGLSEDDFGTSLRTPHRSPEAMPPSAHSSVDSLTSALTTTDNALSLRTQMSSDSLNSESSSLAGRKRAHGALRSKTQNTLQSSYSQNATLRGRPASPSILGDSLQSGPSEDEDENQPGNTNIKRQKVLDPLKRKSTVRPSVRTMGSTRRALPSKNSAVRDRAVATGSQATLRNRERSVTTNNSTMRGRKPTLVPRQATRSRPQGVIKSSSTSSSQSGTLKGRMP